GLDEGTRLLLSALTVHPDDRVLDVGCGYGIIGMVAAMRRPSASVTMVDADLLAVACARETLRRNGLAETVRVVLGDGPQALGGERFTLIVSNPPFHAGHEVTLDIAHSFVAEAFEALEMRGRLILVANRFLPYHRAMEATFGEVEVLAQTSLYRVLAATKRSKRAKPRASNLVSSR
ncbi:MAG: methyltransferase, partial [Chloroflexi bacterium]|nr:methyltransferase [Chloroflexota bacterium]